MSRVKVTLVTPYRHLVDLEVDEVTAPTISGEIGVLPEHDMYLLQLVPGAVTYKDGDKVGHFAIGGGFAEVGADRIIILAETAEEAAEIDVARAVQAKESAETALSGELSDEEYDEARAQLERAVARMNVGARIK